MIDGNGTNGPNGNGLGFSRLTPKENQQPMAAGGLPPAGATTPSANTQAQVIQPPKKRRKAVESKLNFNEIIKMLYRGRWIILATFVLFFAYSVYSTYNKPVIYGSSTRLLVEKSPVSEKELGPLFAQREDHSIANQIQFFKSHVVAEHVAKVIHKYANGDRGEIDSLFQDYFKNTAAIPPDPNQLSLIRIVDNPKLEMIPGVADINMIRSRVQVAVNIIPEPNNDYLAVSAEAYTPLDAALIVNTYIVVFAKDNLARLRHNNIVLKEFLANQKARSYDTLHKIESELQANMMEGYSFDIESRSRELMKQVEDYRSAVAAISMRMERRRNIIEELQHNLDSAKLSLSTDLIEQPVIKGLQELIASEKLQITMQRSENVVMNPRTKKYMNDDIRAKEDRVAKLEEELKEKVNRFVASQKVIITDVNAKGEQTAQTIEPTQAIMKLKEAVNGNMLALRQDSLELYGNDSLMSAREATLALLPMLMGRMGQLKRQQESAERIYAQMEDKYMDAWFSEQSVFGNVKVEDPAGLNATPIRPNRQADIFMGSLIGLALGIGVVVVLAMMDSTVRSPEELESQGLNVLAAIPVIGQVGSEEALAAAGAEGRPKFTPHRVSHLDPRSSIAESYRSLRTSLQFAGLDKPIRTIAVSSSAPQEGKSTTSSNLGVVMSQMGKKTLLVDTDLRRPVLHSVFGIEREPGLTNILFDRSALHEAIHPTDVPNLYVLPCGIIPPNPAELLGSEKMNQLIEVLKEEFDFIIFDTPPVVAVTDALLLGMQTDAMVLIARADVSKSDGVLRAVDAVERSNIRFLGVILNNFNVSNAYGAYYRYYQYYHYYSNEGPQKSGVMQKLGNLFNKLPKSSNGKKEHSSNGEKKHHKRSPKEHA